MTLNEAKKAAAVLGQPTEELMQLAVAALAARTYADNIRPTIERHQRETLAAGQYSISREWVDLGEEPGIITEPSDSYLMPKQEWVPYDEACAALHRAAGFEFAPGTCPLLVAEEQQRQAERAFIYASRYLKTGVDSESSEFHSETRTKYMQLTLQFVLPFVGEAVQAGNMKVPLSLLHLGLPEDVVKQLFPPSLARVPEEVKEAARLRFEAVTLQLQVEVPPLDMYEAARHSGFAPPSDVYRDTRARPVPKKPNE